MEEPVPRAPQPAAAVVVAPRPKSPPKYPDVCGRRRLQLELHILNREIANHCAVAGGLLAVLNNGAVAAVDHNGAVPEDLHASDHAVSEIGAVV
ncbi:hypothetical protein C4D60_Mb05t12550 [Musa balbisiana]|uniref:Uncharacterized protein n=1 Tax=Musa balbisiana TaxID=52838 RepID=A0A4S8JVN5_MUSBA|nr:hypothetical protein C4D60_Mb05t12550 [Musa balbisiana]